MNTPNTSGAIPSNGMNGNGMSGNGTTNNGTTSTAKTTNPLPHGLLTNDPATTTAVHDLPKANGLPDDGTSDGTPVDLTVRQAAQPHAPVPPALGTAGENDPLPRPLDEEGQPKPRPIVFLSPTLPSSRSTRETARREVIEKLKEHFPIRASELEADFDDGVLAARERHLDDERFEWERLEHENAEIERRNKAIEARCAELEQERDQATQPDKERVLVVDELLHDANCKAAMTVSRAHGVFDSAHVVIETIRHSMRVPLVALSGLLRLPFVPEDAHWGEHVARWSDPACGALLGLSATLFGGVVEASALKTLQPGTLVVAFLFMAIGAVIGIKAGEGLAGESARLSEVHWLELPWSHKVSPLLRTVFWATLMLTVWTVVDGFGIMKLMAVHEANQGRQVSLWKPLVAGAVASVPFVAFALVRGSRQGRFHAVQARLVAAQEQDLRERPKVAEAMDAVGQVCELLRQKAALLESIAQIEAPFQQEIARLKTMVRDPRFALDSNAQQRLRDSRDDWTGGFGVWKADLSQMVDEVEPLRVDRRISAGEEQGGKNAPQNTSPAESWIDRLKKFVLGRRK